MTTRINILLIAIVLLVVLLYNTAEQFIDYRGIEKIVYHPGFENPIDYSIYEIKDPKRYVDVRVFMPEPNKESSLFGNFRKSEKLPPSCDVIHHRPRDPWA